MPKSHLTKAGRKTQAAFTKRYGKKRGKAVFYATMQGAKGKTKRKLFAKGSRMR